VLTQVYDAVGLFLSIRFGARQRAGHYLEIPVRVGVLYQLTSVFQAFSRFA
jgi:hypothetical protein